MNPSPRAARRFPAVLRLPRGRLVRFAVGCEIAAALGLLATIADTDLDQLGQLPRDALIVAVAVAAGAATVWLDEGHGRARLAIVGAIGLLLGLVALASGAIVGLASLLIEGPRLKAAFGLAGFAGGLGLTVAAAIWLLRALPRWWRLAGVPGAYVVLQFLVLPLVMAMLGTHAPRPSFTAETPQGAQRMTFHAADGTELAGWYTPSTNGATVIVLAGAGSTRADVGAQSAVLARHGYGVLAFDARGTGESGGHPHLWGWGGELDAFAALDYLVSMPGVDPNRIGMLGESMGGEVAITAAASDGRIRAVVAEGATARTCADLTFLGNDPEGGIHRTDSCLGWAIAAATSGAREPKPLLDEVRALGSRPALLIAADLPEEHAATESWRSVSPATIQLWEPASTGHTAGLSTHPAEWEQRVVAFLDAALIGSQHGSRTTSRSRPPSV